MDGDANLGADSVPSVTMNNMAQDDVDLEVATVADARDLELERRIANVTSLSETTISKRLRSASGNTLLRNLFDDHWPSGYTVGQVRNENLYREVALCMGVETKLVRAALEQANGNALARNAVADALAVWEELANDEPAHVRQMRSMGVGGIATHRSKVFVSYSHRDSRWLQRLQVHLAPLVDEGLMAIWDDTKIDAGGLWREEIDRAISQAGVAVLLVSADFLASGFIRKTEIPPLLVAAKREGALILPIIVGPCLFVRTPELSRFQALNAPSRPLTAMNEHEQEDVLFRAADRIHGFFKKP